jgi:uncharacterized protein GlcG (DUF336 family)
LVGKEKRFVHALVRAGNGYIYALVADRARRRNLIYRVHLPGEALEPERALVSSESRPMRALFEMVLARAVAGARTTNSALRRGAEPVRVRMHIVVMPRNNPSAFLEHSDADVWLGSISIARGKAYTALAFSSDANAMTTRRLGELSQPGQPLWGIAATNKQAAFDIVTFPGGIPLYDSGGKLVGAIGVSGDGVEQDEAVALFGAEGYVFSMKQ